MQCLWDDRICHLSVTYCTVYIQIKSVINLFCCIDDYSDYSNTWHNLVVPVRVYGISPPIGFSHFDHFVVKTQDTRKYCHNSHVAYIVGWEYSAPHLHVSDAFPSCNTVYLRVSRQANPMCNKLVAEEFLTCCLLQFTTYNYTLV